MNKRILIMTLLVLIWIVNLTCLDLGECLKMAKQNNKQLLALKEDINKADQSFNEIKGSLFPQIYLQGGYQLSTTYLPDSSIPRKVDFAEELDSLATENEEYLADVLTGFAGMMSPGRVQKTGALAAQVQMDQVLFLGGKLVNGIKAVNRVRAIQRLRYTLSEQELVARTTEMFYQTLLAQKVWNIQQEALDIAQKHYDRVELLNREGQVSDFDMLRARLEVAKLKPQVTQAHKTYNLAISAMRKLIGFSDSLFVLDGEFILPEIYQADYQLTRQEALKNRIELRLSALNTQISGLNYSAEKGNYLPNVFLSANYSIFTRADEYKIERDDYGSQYQIGIGFQIPLFTGWANKAKRSYAKHQYRQGQINHADLEDMVDLEVQQTYQSLQVALENYQLQLENIKLAERGLQLAQVRYENQVSIQLEVFDAQIMLSGVKLSYYQAIYEVISANQKYKKAIGIML